MAQRAELHIPEEVELLPVFCEHGVDPVVVSLPVVVSVCHQVVEHPIEGPLMKAGERYWREDVKSFFDQYGEAVASAAEEHGIEPEILIAVLMEEMSHQIPYLESEEVEQLGIGRTVGPAQILDLKPA